MVITIDELQELNLKFWEEENEKRERGIADPVLWRSVKQELDRDQMRGVPIAGQESIEFLLERADRLRRDVNTESARRAGRAPKADALQQYIVALVRKRPDITSRQLLAHLEQERWNGLIVEIADGMVCFLQPDGIKDGRTKETPISGLKDRLSRAKKQVHSR
jgi:hypothetical protein